MSSPILISLDMIAAHNPCKDGWKKIVAARGGDAADYAEMFQLADALCSNGLDDTLWALRCIDGHERLKRRFAAWCARQVMHLNDDPRVLAAIVAAEDFADGRISAAASDAARDAACDAARDAACDAARAAASDAAYAASDAARDAASDAAYAASDAARAAASAAAYAASDAARDAASDAAYAASDAARDAARAAASTAAYAASAAARAAASTTAYAARDAASAAASAAQADKLREILMAGGWV